LKRACGRGVSQLPYAQQLEQKRRTVLAALTTLARKARKEAFASSRGEKTALPQVLQHTVY
jgi:hypothetical protein